MQIKKLNVRARAAQVCYQVLEQGQSLSQCLPKAHQGLSSLDQGLVSELSYGVIRNLSQLDAMVRQKLSQPLKSKKRVVHYLILVGVYQIYMTRVPTHAAVSETVEACKQLQQSSLAKLVNGVLRALERERPELEQTSPALKHNHPSWLIKSLKSAYPDQWQSILEQNNQRPPFWLRVNLSQRERSEYLALLEELNLKATMGASPSSILLSDAIAVEKLPKFDEGAVSVQDAAAQWAAFLLEPEVADYVLDACAAPGGKTCHILERQSEIESLVAVDKYSERLDKVRENLQRIGLEAELTVGDTCDFKSWHDGTLFDKILLDAPCSATGVIRRHPDIKWLRQPRDIDSLVEVQAKMLDACWQNLKPGGVLLYATCSVLPQENQLQIQNFLSRMSDAKLIDIDPHQSNSIGWQILPGEQDMDGFYYAKIIKVSS